MQIYSFVNQTISYSRKNNVIGLPCDMQINILSPQCQQCFKKVLAEVKKELRLKTVNSKLNIGSKLKVKEDRNFPQK